ncbi:MAG: hypothetical protein KTR16_10185 [Acidiferrobacterales bacterium]|nr:hypothetical protein [Acidiferrobacterales bacterium]
MRLIGYSLVCMLALLPIGFATSTWLTDSKQEQRLEDENYRRINAYELKPNQTIAINYASSAVSTKLIFYAILPKSLIIDQSDENTDYPFSVEYRFDQEAEFEPLTLATQHTSYSHADTSEPTPITRLFETNKVVSSGKSLEFNLPSKSQTRSAGRRLELRLTSTDPKIDSVVLRSFFRERSSLENSQQKWARLSKRQQNYLARLHPFGRFYLDKNEIHNLLINRQQAIAPSGIEGRDFKAINLWSHQEPDLLIPTSTEALGELNNLGPNLQQSLRVLKPSDVEFKYRVPNNQSARVNFTQQSNEGLISSKQLPVLIGDGRITYSLPAGDYIFSSEQLLWFDIQESESVQTGQIQRRFYSLNDQQHYSLSPSLTARQLVRIEIINQPQQTFDVRYELLDKDGKAINTGTITHLQEQDSSSYVSHLGPSVPISVISEHQLTIPSEASELKLISDQGEGMIRVSNSLESLAAKVTLSTSGNQFVSNWFELEPNNAARPLDGDSANWLISHGRFSFDSNATPPEIERLTPTQATSFYTLMERVDANTSAPASAITFNPIRTGQSYAVDLRNKNQNDSTTSLRVLYLGSKPTHAPISISINGKPYSYQPYNDKGLIRLPQLPVGEHTFRYSNKASAKEGPRLYLNQVTTTLDDQTTSYKQRLMWASETALTFPLAPNKVNHQTLQILIASTDAQDQFDVNIIVVTDGKKRRLRTYKVSAPIRSHAKSINIDSGEDYYFVPAIYLPLSVLGGNSADELSIEFSDGKNRLISVATMDRSGEKRTRAFHDWAEWAQ